MGFDYDRIRSKQDGDNFWTSYSDLLLMLSTVFLMLYVFSSLRSGAGSIQQNIEHRKLVKETEDLREQLKVYNTLKEEQLSKENEGEQQVYSQLMDKLSLLQDQASEEKKSLSARARENAQKEMALNKYQQVIRNIINANLLAKGQIKRRDSIIETQETDIAEKSQAIRKKDVEIKGLTRTVATREQEIAENRERIAAINAEMDAKIKRLRDRQRKTQGSKKALEKAIAELKTSSTRQVASLEQETREAADALRRAKAGLASATRQVAEVKHQATQAIAEVTTRSEAEKAGLRAEKQGLVNELERTQAGYRDQVARLKQESDARLGRERAAMQAALNQQQASAAERQRQEAAFRARAEGEARSLAGKLASLDGKLKAGQAELDAAKAGEARAAAAAAGMKGQLAGMAGQLKEARASAEARKELAAAIQRGFARAGIKAGVDVGTGDVVLAFPDDYFDTGAAFLTGGMRQRLDKFIPTYTQALFSDPKIAAKISNVELIGFASSTFKGKYVNPTSLSPADREAIEYNLKLSFNRANAIFKHIFDTSRLNYAHQKDLLPMVKVVGRGYLPEGRSPAEIPPGMPEREFCAKFNCKAAQKVLVRFNLKE